MERVSLEIAKILKEAGYPQGNEHIGYYNEFGELIKPWVYNSGKEEIADAPTYLDMWLWLWREKNIQIDVVSTFEKTCVVVIWESGKRIFVQCKCIDPEDAIVAAIDYLVENNLIK